VELWEVDLRCSLISHGVGCTPLIAKKNGGCRWRQGDGRTWPYRLVLRAVTSLNIPFCAALSLRMVPGFSGPNVTFGWVGGGIGVAAAAAAAAQL
jgi:hypothetical protein